MSRVFCHGPQGEQGQTRRRSKLSTPHHKLPTVYKHSQRPSPSPSVIEFVKRGQAPRHLLWRGWVGAYSSNSKNARPYRRTTIDSLRKPSQWEVGLDPIRRMVKILWASAIAMMIAVPPYTHTRVGGIRYFIITGQKQNWARPGVPRIHVTLLAAQIAGVTGIMLWICRRKRFPVGFCGRCGYDLRGNPDMVCPECGARTPPHD